MSFLPYPLSEYTVRVVGGGLALLGAVAGVLGTFAVVRRQSLQGDAVSHAALPGVALAFLFGGRSPLALVFGGAVAGWVAMRLVTGIVRRSRIPFDTALAGALAVFFGAGITLMTYLQKLATRRPANPLEEWMKPAADASVGHGLERYLFGQAAFLNTADLWAIVGLGGGAVLVVMLFWKEFKLISFDPDFAASVGYPVRLLDAVLTTLIVVSVVIGLQSVGVVLMSALLVAPATAARQWTNRLGVMAAVSAAFGAVAGFTGEVVSHIASSPGRTVPTGPTVVLGATLIVVVSLLFGSKRGLVWQRLQYRHSKPSDTP
ncbi:MAG: metal ABC transporter permease [Fimbriiglobus sp.]|nr:metal ABC transporter permease [Fimbriiglobus sp.]